MQTLQTPNVDAIVLFAGGVYPETGKPNHLSIGRMWAIENYVRYFSKNTDGMPHIIVNGGLINYHTGLISTEPPSDVYKQFLVESHLIDIPEDRVISTRKGFCTITEALAAREVIKEHKWKTIMFTTSKEHESRAGRILQHVLGEEYRIIRNPASLPDGKLMNEERERLLAELFIKHFGRYNPGDLPYMNDKIFYYEHLLYYDIQRSTIEGTAQGHGWDSMAYLHSPEKE